MDPDDVGVVAYYRDLEAHSSEQLAIACDQWETQCENARSIALWVRRVRLADRCGVETAWDIDEVAQLPPAGPRGRQKAKIRQRMRTVTVSMSNNAESRE
ncbi:hypothetical protein [Haloterrigena salifodinae]|uniref:hypothetical protein n=1 Tax=Haloterrigena salifodinae TaxID=2675099 RepID=UPI000F85DF3E|nr:hypothetical protein [Haloterrigena salifodinae]